MWYGTLIERSLAGTLIQKTTQIEWPAKNKPYGMMPKNCILWMKSNLEMWGLGFRVSGLKSGFSVNARLRKMNVDSGKLGAIH